MSSEQNGLHICTWLEKKKKTTKEDNSQSVILEIM
jgi:hypothetical protein